MCSEEHKQTSQEPNEMTTKTYTPPTKEEQEYDFNVANTILSQIGRMAKMSIRLQSPMAGREDGKSYVQFVVKPAGKRGPFKFRIALNSMDTYDVTLYRLKNTKMGIEVLTLKEASGLNGIYADNLDFVLDYWVRQTEQGEL